jgi:hypothetical protein
MDLPNKAEQQFTLGTNLAEKFLAQQPELKLKPEVDVTYDVVMLFFFSKSYKTYQAIAFLWRSGFYEDAWLLTRTLFEIWMQAAYLREKPMERTRQFREHGPVSMYRGYHKLKKHGEHTLTAAFESRDDFAEIKCQYYLHNTTAGPNWFGNSLRCLADELGTPFDREYLIGYWWQSNFVHTAIATMQHFVIDPEAHLRLNCHPGNVEPQLDVKLAPQGATMYMISVVDEVSDALSINLRSDIQSARLGLQVLDVES